MEEKNLSTRRGFFGRRTGRTLSPARRRLLDSILKTHSFDPQHYNYTKRPVWMEIGFGDGEHLAALMNHHPDHNFIGFEPYINGMGNFINRIQGSPYDHMRVCMDDAIPVLHDMPDACLNRLYVLNPDPWPKTRHHKRRIINQKNLDIFARLLKPKSLLIMATDVAELAEWMVTQTTLHPAFQWTANTPDDWKVQPDWWAVTTRYAQKGLDAGRCEYYLIFERV